MDSIEKISINIEDKYNIGMVIPKVSEFVKDIGFSEKENYEINLIITELAENLIIRGKIERKITCSIIEENGLKGVKIVSKDKGSGIANVDVALEDGYSSNGTIGVGLGTIKRLTDEFKLVSSAENIHYVVKLGTTIINKKFLNHENDMMENKTKFGVFTRSKIGESFNGDNYFLKHFKGKTMAAVIDGLGHGRFASEASSKAKIYLKNNYNKPLDVIINQLNIELKKTRGVVISIALIDNRKEILKYVGIGNVKTKIYNSSDPINTVNFNGVVGYSLRKLKVFLCKWEKNNVIIMTSDGISENYEFEKNFNFSGKHPMIIADMIFKKYGKNHDDATILVGIKS